MIDYEYKFEISPTEYTASLSYADAVDYCNNLVIDGKSGWKLPTLTQLSYYSHTSGKSSGFMYDLYWILDDNIARGLKIAYDFDDRDVRLIAADAAIYCRPVRDIEITVDLIDNIELGPTTSCIKWEDAKLYCFSLNIDGKIGWRLPTIEELDAIHERYKTFNSWYWSDNSYGDDIYYLDLRNGLRGIGTREYLGISVLPVRDLKDD